jgi:tetratricopeptide (TPR) repeat protein
MSVVATRLRAVLLAALAAAPLAVGLALVVAPARPGPTLEGVDGLLRARRFDDAEARVRAFLRAHPDHGRAVVLLAQVLVNRPDPKPAEALGLLGKYRPRDRAEAALMRVYEGKALAALSRHDRAEAAWRAALDLDPTAPEAGWALLGLFYVQGRREDAHRLALALHATEPDPRDRAQLLLELLRQDAQPLEDDSIIKTFRPVVRDHPDEFRASLALGRALARTGQADEGISLLRDQVSRHAGRPEAWEALLAALDEAGQPIELAEALGSLPAPVADDPRFDRHRGKVAQDRHDLPSAIDAYLHAWRSDPSDVEVAYRLARTLRLAGRAEEADRFDRIVRDMQAAGDSALPLYEEANAVTGLGVESHPELSRRLADLRERMGRRDEALAWHRLVLRTDPVDPLSLAAVARLASAP